MSSYVEHFAGKVVAELKHCVDNGRGNSILIRVANQNVIPIMAAITEYVAKIDNWGPTDYTTYNSFNIAKQRLYLLNNIYVDVVQKPMTHPDWSHDQFEVGNYSTVFIDHELNADDPYFNVIKRDYYNEVSN